MKPVKDYINLLPPEEKKPLSVAMWGGVAALVFMLVWAGIFGWQVRQYRLLKNRSSALSLQKQSLDVQADALRKELATATPSGMTRDKAALIQDILQERVLWSEVFRHLSRIVPTGLWFDYLEGVAGDTAQIKIKGGAFNYLSIADFMVSMEKSGFFEHPQLSYAQKTVVQGQDIVGFEIICGMKRSQVAGAR